MSAPWPSHLEVLLPSHPQPVPLWSLVSSQTPLRLAQATLVGIWTMRSRMQDKWLSLHIWAPSSCSSCPFLLPTQAWNDICPQILVRVSVMLNFLLGSSDWKSHPDQGTLLLIAAIASSSPNSPESISLKINIYPGLNLNLRGMAL